MYTGSLFCFMPFKTLYFVLYCNLLVGFCEWCLDSLHIGAVVPKFHRYTNGGVAECFASRIFAHGMCFQVDSLERDYLTSNEQLTSLWSADIIQIFLRERTTATCMYHASYVGICSKLGLSILAAAPHIVGTVHGQHVCSVKYSFCTVTVSVMPSYF